MIQVPDAIKTLLRQDSIAKNFRVSFPNGEFRDLVNADIVSESVVFTESISSGEGLKFGLCEGAHLDFQTYFDENIKNKKIYAEIEVDVSSIINEEQTEKVVTNRTLKGQNPDYMYFTLTDSVEKLHIFSEMFDEYERLSAQFAGHRSDGNLDIKDVVLSVNTGESFLTDVDITLESNPLKDDYPSATYESLDVIIYRTLDETPGREDTDSDYEPIVILRDVDVTTTFWHKEEYNFENSDDVSYPYYAIPYGYFYVDSCQRDAQTGIRKIVAYQNKYNNNTLTGNTIGLSEFEKLKLRSTGTTSDYIFNYPFALASIFNKMNTLNGFGISYSTSNDIPLARTVNGSTTESTSFNLTHGGVDLTTWKAKFLETNFYNSNGEKRSIEFSIMVKYRSSIFSSISELNFRCPGGEMNNGYVGDPNFLLYSTPAINKLYSVSMNYDKTPLSVINSLYSKVLDIVASEESQGHTKRSYSKRYSNFDFLQRFVAPTLTAVGQCSSSTGTENGTINKPVPSNYVDLSPDRAVVGDIDVLNSTFLFYPYNKGVTDYTGNNKHQNPTNKLGCIGYNLFIPYTVYITQDVYRGWGWDGQGRTLIDTSTIYEEKLLDPTTITGKTYTTSISFAQNDGAEFLTTINRDKRKAQGLNYTSDSGTPSTVKGNVYEAASILNNSDNSVINLQDALESLIELNGAFGKIDRITNKLVFKRLVQQKGLYPETSLYPSTNIYPEGEVHNISTSQWKTIWYDDKFTNTYRRVFANWRDGDVDKSYVYTIIPEEEIENLDDYKEYDLSSNFFITNGKLSEEAIHTVVDNVGELIKDIQYHVSTIEMRALPYMEAGDGLVAYTNAGGLFTYCLRHRISGIQALMDSIEAR